MGRNMSKRTECRHGNHRFLAQVGVGAGIRRSVCSDCGVVAIEIIDEQSVTTVSDRLLEGRIDAGEYGDAQELDLLASSAFGRSTGS